MLSPHPDDYDEVGFQDQIAFDLVNLFHDSDILHSWVQNVPFDPEYIYIAAHGNNDTMANLIFVDGEVQVGEVSSEEDIADIIYEYQWDEDYVCLFACSVAEQGEHSFAQKVADQIQGAVTGPIDILHICRNGFYYVCNESIMDITDERLLPEYQENMWDIRIGY